MTKKYSRQTGIINPKKLTDSIIVVGVGAVGSWTVLALAKMGCKKIKVVDFDKVELQNTASQIYSKKDIGRYKVDSLSGYIKEMTGIKIETYNKRWEELTDKEKTNNIVISAVDDIDVRKVIWADIKSNPEVDFLIDGRMAKELIRIFMVLLSNKSSMDYYEKTLKPKENIARIPCSERAVVFNVFVVAGLIADMVAQWTNKTLEGKRSEIIFDLANMSTLGGEMYTFGTSNALTINDIETSIENSGLGTAIRLDQNGESF